MQSKNKQQTSFVYGLDIGTRSIVGTVGYKQKDRFVVVSQYVKEHESRAMLDGQIHDINAVSESIKEVTEVLQERVGEPLKQVCIAAAGRVLKTVNAHAEMTFESEHTISKEDIFALDSLGIERAYDQFTKDNDVDTKFYCVGYSVIHYFMNGYPMNTLENHKAKEISCDLIATFLPDDVVDGLYKAVELAGLEVANLTLEPIAAIELAIPEMYRMLNIALIDVGAGTSDISITKDGSIIAYGMLPIAGDCLTEKLARHCLVDFQTAETIKRGIDTDDVVEYKDIMGIVQKISKDEVLELLNSDIEQMASMAADKIKELNGGKPVSAVFVVGGGGKIATYTDKVASYLGIASDRCAVRGEEVMMKIDFLEKDIIKDSLLVTPIGICLNFYEQSNNFIYVTFNDKRVKLYDNAHLSVMDVAINAEFTNDDLFPKRGESLEFTLNGKPMLIRGNRGESAEIYLNGKSADLNSLIHSNDVVKVVPSTAGEKAEMVVSKLPEYDGNIVIHLDDTDVTLPRLATVNGELQSSYYQIQNNDQVELLNYYTVSQIMEFLDMDKSYIAQMTVNHENATAETKVYDNFTVSIAKATERAESESDEVIDIIETDGDTMDMMSDSTLNHSIDTSYVNETKVTSSHSVAEEEIDGNVYLDQAISALSNGDAEGGLSALEQAKLNAQNIVDELAFEHAEERLSAMISQAMGMVSGASSSLQSTNRSMNSGASISQATNAASNAIPDMPVFPKVEKSARELFGSIQNNINRLNQGADITDIRKEAPGVQDARKQLYGKVNGQNVSSKADAINQMLDDLNQEHENQDLNASHESNTATENVAQANAMISVPDVITENVNGKLLTTIHVIVNDTLVKMSGKEDYIYVDVFQFYDFDLSKPQGSTVETLLNGRVAQYTENLSNGDVLKIFWKE